jgi:ubiquinone/menaquinone biosynthesis C-methylase UbiE
MDPTRRFSNRVDNYVKYRPSYPAELIDLMIRDMRLTPSSIIAEIGSGTGKMTELLIARGLRISAIEPNTEMRHAAEALLRGFPNFTSVAAPAEATTLAPQSVDAIIVAQAFHWFDHAKCRVEFDRILKPGGGPIALIWNVRNITASEFQYEYEQLLKKHSPEYPQVRHREFNTDKLKAFFGKAEIINRSFDYRQVFNFEELKGRLLSSSYAPNAGPACDAMLQDLRILYDKFQRNDSVMFLYDTQLFLAK